MLITISLVCLSLLHMNTYMIIYIMPAQLNKIANNVLSVDKSKFGDLACHRYGNFGRRRGRQNKWRIQSDYEVMTSFFFCFHLFFVICNVILNYKIYRSPSTLANKFNHCFKIIVYILCCILIDMYIVRLSCLVAFASYLIFNPILWFLMYEFPY